MAFSAPTQAAPSIQAPTTYTMNRELQVDNLRHLAASAMEEAKCKSENVIRLRNVANRAQAEVQNLVTKATELTRQADSLEKKPAKRDVNGLLPPQLKVIRAVRKRLRETLDGGKSTAKPARELEERKSHLELVLEDSMVSAKLRNECLQEIGEDAVALACAKSAMGIKTSKGRVMKIPTPQEMETDTDIETDELQILDDTAEVRALFQKKADDISSALAQAEHQDTARPVSAEDELLAEQQILAELQASAIVPIRTLGEPEQLNQLNAGGALPLQMPKQDRRSSEYRPTERDMALGLKWTLLSCETVREDLDREIQEGHNQPYVAGHIAIMRRKTAILRYLAQERDAPPNVIDEELVALERALSTAEQLVKPASVREANKYLRNTDDRNLLHLTLCYEGAEPVRMAMNRKRKHQDETSEGEDGGSQQNTIGHCVKRRRRNHARSILSKALHAPGQRHKPQALVYRVDFGRSQELALLDPPSTNGSESTEDEPDSDDREDR
jgi:hypothetical protein